MGQDDHEELDLESYIHENLISEDKYYVVNKVFWNQWSKKATDG